jgi:uncharacterized iron-regulated membrane protein
VRRRRWFEIHSWLGVITGLMLFLICWSGTTAVLSYEIDWLLDPRLRVEPQPQRTSWGELAEAVRLAHPEANGISLHAGEYARSAVHADIELPNGDARRVYLNPYSAEVLGTTSLFNVQRFFRNLHMSLFDVSNDYGGYWFVGAFGILLLVSTVTPLLFYRRWWRGFFTLKTGRGARVFWSDVHKLAGVWALLFSLLMAITGIWYLLEWAKPIAYPETPRVETPPKTSHPTSAADLDALVDRATATWPELQIRTVGLPEGSYWGRVVYLDGQATGWLVRDRSNRVLMDPATAEIRYRQSSESIGWPARWIDTADPLHFGNFGGLGIKLLWFGFGLLLSGLCLTGTYLHVQRLRSSGAQRARTRGATSANVIWVALLIGAGVLGIISLGDYRAGDALDSQLDIAPAVAAFLIAWTVVTALVMFGLFSRGAGPVIASKAPRSPNQTPSHVFGDPP